MLQSTDNASKLAYTPSTNNPVTPVKTMTSPIEQATIGRTLVIKGEISGSESLYIDGDYVQRSPRHGWPQRRGPVEYFRARSCDHG